MADDAIPAATLVVMRDMADGPPELLMVTRTARMAFAAGAMVFPGGRIDDGDRALAASDEDAAKVAAIRETIEETGLSVGLPPAAPPSLQEHLHAGAPFADLLDRHGLALDLAALVPFARWKPTFKHTRRFDTLFFLARAPANPPPLRPQPGECDGAEWLTAAAVIARVAAGTANAIFPTVRNLERLAQFASFNDAAAHAAAHPVETISPWIEEAEGEQWLRIPDHLGYPVTRERLSSAVRG
ncbi:MULTISPECIES: NUDIX domain-containing protein [Sphingomonas]|uniref:NUDIX domain-containing protein n=1 Tax=Sphingomonas TaxID=13687 RepID=UPI000DEF4474|nr:MULTISPECIES: NUDIX domain-containing protein [Sphingomonas]